MPKYYIRICAITPRLKHWVASETKVEFHFARLANVIIKNMSDMNTPPKIPAELLARLNGGDAVFHSNAYAQEAHGDRIGSTSVSSFHERLHLEKNRRSVRSYRESAIGAGVPSKHGADATTMRRGVVAPQPRQGGTTPIAKPSTFREPPTRPYNPYS